MRPTPAPIAGRIRPLTLLFLVAGFASSCSEGPVDPSAVKHIALVAYSNELRPGAELQVFASPVDAAGHLVESPPVRWRSLTPDVMSVSDDGLVRGLAPGVGIVRASVGSVASHLAINLVNPPIASLVLDVVSLQLSLPGGTRTIVAEPRDAEGIPIIGEPLSWSSSASRIADVNAAGRVSAIAVGLASVAVRGGEISRTVNVTVDAPPSATSPVITGLAPVVALPGTTLIVNGTGFSGNPGANAVLIDGTPIPVTAASATQLVLSLPSAATFPCEPTRVVALQVTTSGGIGVASIPLQVASQRSLAVGQSLTLATIGEARCNEFAPAEGRYLLTVPNVARALGAREMSLSVRGDVLSMPGASASNGSGSAVRAYARGGRADIAFEPAARSRLTAHARLLDASRVIAAGGRTSAVRAAPSAGPARDLVAGDIVPLRLPALEQPNFCSAFTGIGARTVYVGARFVLLEDTLSTLDGAATLAGKMDDHFTSLGDELEAVGWEILQTFGNPLVMDSRLDDDRRIRIVFSPRMNRFFAGSVLAAVVNCDFFPRAQFASSNVGEYVYAQVPTSLADGFAAGTRTRWRHEIRATLPHELKHVTSYAERIVRGQPLEEPWLEEATARHAEELFARAIFGASRNGNSSAGATLKCELRAGDPLAPQCAGAPRAMRQHVEALWSYLDAPATHSVLGPVAAGDFAFYGSAWALTRWLVDQEGFNEPAFFTALTTSGQSGVDNLVGRSGRGWDEMLVEWSLAMATDDRAGFAVTSDRLTFPSWNLASLFQALCDHDGACGDPGSTTPYERSHPLQPVPLQTGEFLLELPVVSPGGFAAIELTTTGGGLRQLVELRGFRGGPLPATARLGILRIE